MIKLRTGHTVLRFNHYIQQIFLVAAFVMFAAGNSFAACSPGIPCTDYDIYTNTNAGESAALNGLKTGQPSPYDTGACDGNFMNQIYSKAFLEGSRDVITSQQLIHKPDSVLEYTCFDKRIEVMAEHAGAIFTESQRWDDREICMSTGGHYNDDPENCSDSNTYNGNDGENTVSEYSVTINDGSPSPGTLFPDQDDFSVFQDDRVDNVLEDFLFDVVQDYVDLNFSHTFMGEATTIDNDIDTASFNGSDPYDCSHMATVWNIARCVDFSEDDRFRSFSHLMEFDPRSIPQACTPASISSDAIEAGDDPTKLDSTDSGLDLDTNSGIQNTLDERCPTGPPGTIAATGITYEHIRLANNCDGTGDNLNQYSSFDAMALYDKMFLGVAQYIPGTGNEAGTIGVLPSLFNVGGVLGDTRCSPPIPTGLSVVTVRYGIGGVNNHLNASNFSAGVTAEVTREYQIHFDHICPNPGCYYQPVVQPFNFAAGIQFPPIDTTGVCVPY